MMVRWRDCSSVLTPLAVREAVSLEGVRARAVQVYWFLRARARQWPAQSPVAPKKARVLGWDIIVDGLLRDSSDDGVRSMIVLLGGVVQTRYSTGKCKRYKTVWSAAVVRYEK